jgi:hypothetical protein
MQLVVSAEHVSTPDTLPHAAGGRGVSIPRAAADPGVVGTGHPEADVPTTPESETVSIERLSIEVDGVFTRRRRGSVPMEESDQQRKSEVTER